MPEGKPKDKRIGTMMGPHRLTKMLGRGGMGEVYEAQDEVLGRRVALKILREAALDDPNARERFLLEARSAAKLEHPNVVMVYAAGFESGEAYIAMQYVAGGSAQKYLDACGAM